MPEVAAIDRSPARQKAPPAARQPAGSMPTLRGLKASIVVWGNTLLVLLFSSPPSATNALGYGAQFTPVAYVYFPLVAKQPTSLLPGWLAYLNDYRAMAGLPGVAEKADWSYGNWLHARYSVKNDVL